ncbi:uncharacterized protein [Malus domestica]|uniref:uncharacterized protein n=1 Tax=Malus domestica TaxID=3750 RepID=UPI0039770B30
MASVRFMPPRREPQHSAEPSFPDIAQLGEAIVTAIQSAFSHPQMTPLETVYNLKLNHFIGNEGHEGAEKWLNHIEKTFLVMQSQGNFPSDRFTPIEYIDRNKQEFTHLKQGNMSANEYYRMFTDLSRYDPEVTANPVEMLCRFRLGTKKKWCSIVTSTSCVTYQKFYEILLWIEDSENMPSESEDEEEKNGNQRRDDKGKGSSSGGLSSNMQMRDGRFTGGSRFQRQINFGGSGAPLCRMCNIRHFGKCRRGSGGCYTCGQMGHRAAQCPQNQQRPQQSSFPPPAPTQQVSGSSGYAQTGRGGAYHYQGDAAPYTSGQHQYS